MKLLFGKKKDVKTMVRDLCEIYELITVRDDADALNNCLAKYRSKQNPEDYSQIINLKFTDYQWNLLHLAVWYNKYKIIVYLLGQPYANLLMNDHDVNKETPLHLACFKKCEDIFMELVNSGANLETKNSIEESPYEVIKDKLIRKKFLEKSLEKLRRRSNTDDLKIKKFDQEKILELEIRKISSADDGLSMLQRGSKASLCELDLLNGKKRNSAVFINLKFPDDEIADEWFENEIQKFKSTH